MKRTTPCFPNRPAYSRNLFWGLIGSNHSQSTISFKFSYRLCILITFLTDIRSFLHNPLQFYLLKAIRALSIYGHSTPPYSKRVITATLFLNRLLFWPDKCNMKEMCLLNYIAINTNQRTNWDFQPLLSASEEVELWLSWVSSTWAGCYFPSE